MSETLGLPGVLFLPRSSILQVWKDYVRLFQVDGIFAFFLDVVCSPKYKPNTRLSTQRGR